MLPPLTILCFGSAVQRQQMRRREFKHRVLLRSLSSQAVEPAASLVVALRVSPCSGRQSQHSLGLPARTRYSSIPNLLASCRAA
jgi:hypothetical protein